jgi:hypothetical protein
VIKILLKIVIKLNKKAGAGSPPFFALQKKVQKSIKFMLLLLKIETFPILFYEKVIEMLFKIVLRFHILHKKKDLKKHKIHAFSNKIEAFPILSYGKGI